MARVQIYDTSGELMVVAPHDDPQVPAAVAAACADLVAAIDATAGFGGFEFFHTASE